MIRTEPSACAQTVSRVKAWLLSSGRPPLVKIAKEAGVHEKTLRLAIEQDNWNPTVKTLDKLDAVIPNGWRPAPKRQRRAA